MDDILGGCFVELSNGEPKSGISGLRIAIGNCAAHLAHVCADFRFSRAVTGPAGQILTQSFFR